MTATGFYGKLPAYGDFIQRNLPASFVNGWDEWLQHFVSGSSEYLGEQWLEIYLTSPIWRFVFSPGVIDKHCWAGIMMPSVDHVGRYFPFTAVARLPDAHSPLDYMASQSAWFAELEKLSLQALDAQLDLDEFVLQLQKLRTVVSSYYVRTDTATEGNTIQIDMELEDQSPLTVYPYLLDDFLTRSLHSYSVWSTRGSELVMPCVFGVQGLPAVNKIPAMLDGLWEAWGWQQPYKIYNQAL